MVSYRKDRDQVLFRVIKFLLGFQTLYINNFQQCSLQSLASASQGNHVSKVQRSIGYEIFMTLLNCNLPTGSPLVAQIARNILKHIYWLKSLVENVWKLLQIYTSVECVPYHFFKKVCEHIYLFFYLYVSLKPGFL